MLIRLYRNSDLPQVERIHSAQGFGYPLPPIDEPIVCTKLVLEDGGTVRLAAFLKLTAEAFLLMDKKFGSPEERFIAFAALHEQVRLDAEARGLTDVHAFLPPVVARRFGDRLQALGWMREPWSPFTRNVQGSTFPEA